jgi:hypothetical protein
MVLCINSFAKHANKNSHNNYKFFNSFIHRYLNIQLIYFYLNRISIKILFFAKPAPGFVLREGRIFSLSNQNNVLNTGYSVKRLTNREDFSKTSFNLFFKKDYSTVSNTHDFAAHPRAGIKRTLGSNTFSE